MNEAEETVEGEGNHRHLLEQTRFTRLEMGQPGRGVESGGGQGEAILFSTPA